ncbi:stimulus-sensing domain-containing protein [Breoghania sp.]|uniref:stimulus-sensing domain-containing protein n=1 Tax=Breoghania sp. TaxID=2065378 RepID=UPI0026194A45|nr:stimulus-sensing domain-containing protein [Breoghania sp.]MDJ0931031.1 stimulus-sensing domain-containing protein [Breoghania sp.]
MTIIDTRTEAANAGDKRRVGRRRVRRRLLVRAGALLSTYVFSSLTRRIVVLNLVALLALASGILYLNQFRAGLIDARVQSLLIQGQIIAGAIAASATVDTDAITVGPEKLLELQAGESISPNEDQSRALDFPINPERVAPVLRRLISPTKTRARIYDPDGTLILDSRHLYARGQILRYDLPSAKEDTTGWLEKIWQKIKLWMRRGDLPLYEEAVGGNGKKYPEIVAAMGGFPVSIVRVSAKGELIVSVAVPVQRFRAVLGALLLSTQGGDIDDIVAAERWAILRVFLVAAIVTTVLAVMVAGTIAGPVRRLAAAAERVRRGVDSRQEIPEFAGRQDEIGNLARNLRDMTNALYNRIDAIERFAADVAHELKNLLTSLRSAVETLPLARNEESRERLLHVILHDVRRLDRLISDISDASRLDAELARSNSEPLDIAELLKGVVHAAQQVRRDGDPEVLLDLVKPREAHAFKVQGNGSRLGQVFNNLLDNARSFSPADGRVVLRVEREGHDIVITVDDDGPGIRPDVAERIFERFYTDRPEGEEFGNNSGLGLSISRQIVEAHRGTISAGNRVETDEEGTDRIRGARFTVRLPAHRVSKGAGTA